MGLILVLLRHKWKINWSPKYKHGIPYAFVYFQLVRKSFFLKILMHWIIAYFRFFEFIWSDNVHRVHLVVVYWSITRRFNLLSLCPFEKNGSFCYIVVWTKFRLSLIEFLLQANNSVAQHFLNRNKWFGKNCNSSIEKCNMVYFFIYYIICMKWL